MAGAAAVLAGAAAWYSISRQRPSREVTERVRREDALKHIRKLETAGKSPRIESVAEGLNISRKMAADLAEDLRERGLLETNGENLTLTAEGRELALHVIRAHRLWESYLADRTGIDEKDWHREAEHREHHLSPSQVAELSVRLGSPLRDPHGDPIPHLEGDLEPEGGQPLSSFSPGAVVRIIHIEDEPEVIFSQIVAEGLRPGMGVRVLEKDEDRIRFWADGDDHVLAPQLAKQLSVTPLSEEEAMELETATFLSCLKKGAPARILGLTKACRNAERRRLLDLGFVPGAEVEVEMVSPLGDPTAYRVRGTLVALRREQASLIRVSALEPEPA